MPPKKLPTKKADPDAFVPAKTSLDAFPAVSSRALKGLAAKVKKGKDNYKKSDAIYALVSYAERARFLFTLMRESVVPLWDEPMLWGELADCRAHDPSCGSPADVALLLSKITRYSDSNVRGWSISLALPSWPVTLDRLAFRAYLDDPGAFAAWETWAEPIKKGFATVLVRAGKLDKSHVPSLAAELAALHLDGYGLWERQLVVDDGKTVEMELFTNGVPNASFDRFIEMLTTKEAFFAALDEQTSTEAYLSKPTTSLLYKQIHVLRRAPVQNLARLMGNSGLDANTWSRMATVLEERADEPAALFDVARGLEGREYLQELPVVRGVLRLAKRGEPIPPDVDALFSFRGIRVPSNFPDEGSGLDDLVLALKALGRDRARAVIERVVKGQWTFANAFPVLYAFHEEQDLVDLAFGRLTTDDGGTGPVLFGIERLGPRALPMLERRHDELAAIHPVRGEWIRRGIQLVLAREATARRKWDARYDRFLDVYGFEKDLAGKELFNVDYLYSDQVAGIVRCAVAGLSPERRTAWLQANLDFEKPTFARVIPALPRDDLGLIERALVAIAPHAERLRMYNDWVAQLGYDLKDALLPIARAALEASPSPILRKSFDAALGKDKVDAALAGSAAAAVQEESALEKIARLSKRVGGATTAITILERANEPPVGVSRVGGPGYDLADRQPVHDDEPMTHIFTLAVDDVPALRGAFPDAVAVALYVAGPDMNEAFAPYNDETCVIGVLGGDIARGEAAPTSKDLEANAVEAITVDVAAAAFDGGGVADKELHKAIYALHARAGGSPIWLQSEEEGGRFLLQLDERFAPINLGDCGVMYVFDDTAYWQCH